MAWYQALSEHEKRVLCIMLKGYHVADVHPGSLIFVSQQKVAEFVQDHLGLSICVKLFNTCGTCGSRDFLFPMVPSPSWLYSMCPKCANHERSGQHIG